MQVDEIQQGFHQRQKKFGSSKIIILNIQQWHFACPALQGCDWRWWHCSRLRGYVHPLLSLLPWFRFFRDRTTRESFEWFGAGGPSMGEGGVWLFGDLGLLLFEAGAVFRRSPGTNCVIIDIIIIYIRITTVIIIIIIIILILFVFFDPPNIFYSDPLPRTILGIVNPHQKIGLNRVWSHRPYQWTPVWFWVEGDSHCKKRGFIIFWQKQRVKSETN